MPRRPDARALCELGPVLCLHAAADPHPLAGWSRARRAAACIRLDADGPCESLCFYADDGQPCWQLHLLPDSDFLAWSRLLEELRDEPPPPAPASGLLERCLRLARPAWRACALRLHAVPGCPGETALAAAEVRLSPLGEQHARRILPGLAPTRFAGVH